MATDEAAVTEAVAADGRARGVWVNAADQPARCDFILPSVIRRGRLVVALSTGGASPAAARAIREELEGYLGEPHAVLVELAAETRAALRAASVTPNPAQWRRALGDGRVRRLIAEDDPLIQGYDEPEWARRLHYDRPVDESVAVLRAVRASSLQLLRSLAPEEWDRSGTHSESGPYDIDTWLGIYADHSHEHAEQIGRARRGED